MDHWIKRDGQTYGPYTEADLRDYLASGNVVASDLVRTAEKDEWLPLKKMLKRWNKVGQPMLGLRADVASPPDIPWWLVMILDMLTGLTFFVAWDIVEAIWLRRVQRNSRALWFYIIAALLFAVDAPALYSTVLHNIFGAPIIHSTNATWLGIAGFAMRVVARFSMRRSLLEHFNQVEPIGLKLSWWMTLFFGGLYFQYHFNRINDAKRLTTTQPLSV